MDSTATYLYCIVHAAAAPEAVARAEGPPRRDAAIRAARRPVALDCRRVRAARALRPRAARGVASGHAVGRRCRRRPRGGRRAFRAAAEDHRDSDEAVHDVLHDGAGRRGNALPSSRSRSRPEADCRVRGMGRADHQGGSRRDPPQGRRRTGAVGGGLSRGEETGARRRAGGRAGGGCRWPTARSRRSRPSPATRAGATMLPRVRPRRCSTRRSWCPRAAAHASNR